MKRYTIGLLITLVLGLFAAPLAADARQAERVYRVGALLNSAPTTPQAAENFRM